MVVAGAADAGEQEEADGGEEESRVDVLGAESESRARKRARLQEM